MHLTESEEDHIRIIFNLYERTGKPVSTNAIAAGMKTTAASVTDMLKRLQVKQLIDYQKYYGVTLNTRGNALAIHLIRRNRLWNVMLRDKLHVKWDQIESITNQLEHINSDMLIEELDRFLGYPQNDVFGDPIPDSNGKFVLRARYPLNEVSFGQQLTVVGILNHSAEFLKLIDVANIQIGSEIIILEKFDFDQSYLILHKGIEKQLSISIARNLLVRYNNRIDHPGKK